MYDVSLRYDNRSASDFVSLAPGLADMIELAARSSVLDTPVGKKRSDSRRQRVDGSESGDHDHDPDSDTNESFDERSSVTSSSFAVDDESDFISPTKQFVLATGRPSRSSHSRSSKVKAGLKITEQLQTVEGGDENVEPNLVDWDE